MFNIIMYNSFEYKLPSATSMFVKVKFRIHVLLLDWNIAYVFLQQKPRAGGHLFILVPEATLTSNVCFLKFNSQ